jgi:hypothetical protein
MNKTKVAPGKSIAVRDSDGRFVKGNKEGKKFPKGYAGKPKGARNKKTLLTREIAEEVVRLDPETGKRMTNHELYIYMKKRAETSPRIFIFFLEHWLGKPVDYVQHRLEMPTFNIIDSTKPKDDVEEAELVDGERFKLPEGD